MDGLNKAESPKTVIQEIQTAVRHSFVYGFGSVLGRAIGFLMLPIFTRYLSPHDYGILEILSLSTSLLGMFLNMGMTAALLRFYAAANSPQEKREVVSTAFLSVIVTGLLTLLLALAVCRPASNLLFGSGVPTSYLYLSIFSFVLGYIYTIPAAFLRAKEASSTLMIIGNVCGIVVLVSSVYFVVVLKLGIVGALLGPVICNLLVVLYLAVKIFGEVGLRFNWARLREMMSFGPPLVFSNLALFTLHFSDRFFLQRFQSLDAVGVYSVGYKFPFMLNFLLIQPFFMMWQARMYLIEKRPDHAKIFSQIFVLFSLVLVGAALSMSLFSREIIEVMAGPKFSAAHQVIPIVALAYVFCGIGIYVQTGLYLTSRTMLIGIVSAIAAVANLGLNYFLIRYVGMLGAAWATVLGFAAIAAGSYYCAQLVKPIPLGLGRVCKALVIALLLYGISTRLTAQSWEIALPAKVLLLASFPPLLWITRTFSPGDMAFFASARDSASMGAMRIREFLTGRVVNS